MVSASRTTTQPFGVFQVVTIGTWSFLALTHLAGLPHPTLPRLVIFWLTAVLLVPLVRAATRMVGRRHPAYVQNVIIVGSGDVAELVDNKIRQHPEYRLNVVGFVAYEASDVAVESTFDSLSVSLIESGQS